MYLYLHLAYGYSKRAWERRTCNRSSRSHAIDPKRTAIKLNPMQHAGSQSGEKNLNMIA